MMSIFGVMDNQDVNTSSFGSDVSDQQSSGRILLVDDDFKFCRLTSSYLERYGYEVTCAHNGNSAIDMALTRTYDAIILDVMMPGSDGYQVLRRIRDNSDVPVLMLTALGDQETERIIGLEIGADDYLPKTFSPRELLARLKAVLRRNKRTNKPEQLAIGGLTINISNRSATVDDESISLTPLEFDLLLALAQAKGRIKTRDQLLETISDRSYDGSDRSIDVHISALRKKLKDDAVSPRFIRTVRSAGYMLINSEETRT
ncbi:MAG TPA: response regulator transcription factor [Planktothrix sp.]|jgi:DNA-binding response OmpR family regulator